MFSQACIIPPQGACVAGGEYGGEHAWQGNVHGKGGYGGGGHAWQGVCMAGMCMAWAMHGKAVHGGGHAWQGNVHGKGVHGGGHAWQGGMCGKGVCMAGGMHDRGHTWHERWPLQRMVCILLECIFVKLLSLRETTCY